MPWIVVGKTTERRDTKPVGGGWLVNTEYWKKRVVVKTQQIHTSN